MWSWGSWLYIYSNYYWFSLTWDHPSYGSFQFAMRDVWNQLPRQILSVYRRYFVRCCWIGRCIHSKGLPISENKPLSIFWEGFQYKNWVAHISNRATSSSSLVADGNTWGHILTSFIPGRGFIMFLRFSRNRAVNPHFLDGSQPLCGNPTGVLLEEPPAGSCESSQATMNCQKVEGKGLRYHF